MPKPILSDSLFNADDVATAILNKANLAITNENLNVVDRSSRFVVQSGVTSYSIKAYSFMGFMFVNFHVNIPSPTSGQDIYHIDDSEFYPSQDCYFPTISYGQDSAQYIEILTSGIIQVIEPDNPAGGWNGLVNGWYRYAD